MNNREKNEKAIAEYRKKLKAMQVDISKLDTKVLNKAVNRGLASAKRNTPVGQYSNEVNFTTKDGKEVSFTTKGAKTGGFMRRSWKVSRIFKTANGIAKALFNTADYAESVNYGHRIVDKLGNTTGWVKGQFMLKKADDTTIRNVRKEYESEIERINKKYDK